MSDDAPTMDSFWENSKALENLGLEPVGNSHCEEFLTGVADIAANAIREIEQFVEGEMPADVKELFFMFVERAASKAGPQIEVTYG